MKSSSKRLIVIVLLVIALFAIPKLWAGTIEPRTGWVVIDTTKGFETLEKDLKAAVSANGMGVVTQAGPTGAAKARGIMIANNKVIGVFNNDFAVKVLALSTAAMIEAPIRFYLTENDDGTATLSYKMPSNVFAPYMTEGGQALQDLADQLDVRFDAIAKAAR